MNRDFQKISQGIWSRWFLLSQVSSVEPCTCLAHQRSDRHKVQPFGSEAVWLWLSRCSVLQAVEAFPHSKPIPCMRSGTDLPCKEQTCSFLSVPCSEAGSALLQPMIISPALLQPSPALPWPRLAHFIRCCTAVQGCQAPGQRSVPDCCSLCSHTQNIPQFPQTAEPWLPLTLECILSFRMQTNNRKDKTSPWF